LIEVLISPILGKIHKKVREEWQWDDFVNPFPVESFITIFRTNASRNEILRRKRRKQNKISPRNVITSKHSIENYVRDQEQRAIYQEIVINGNVLQSFTVYNFYIKRPTKNALRKINLKNMFEALQQYIKLAH